MEKGRHGLTVTATNSLNQGWRNSLRDIPHPLDDPEFQLAEPGQPEAEAGVKRGNACRLCKGLTYLKTTLP